MGKLNDFHIEFAPGINPVFYAGQLITGCVIVDLNSPMQLRGMVNCFICSHTRI